MGAALHGLADNVQRMLQVREVGSEILTFKTTLTFEEVKKILPQSQRIFRLELVYWESSFNQAEIKLTPDNGIIQYVIDETTDTKKTDAYETTS